MEDGRVAGG